MVLCQIIKTGAWVKTPHLIFCCWRNDLMMSWWFSLILSVVNLSYIVMVSLNFFHSQFFERTILCNSLVWSCAVTGRPGLTYQEALESERRARQSLQNFPPTLVVPLLHLVTLTHRTRLHEICDDVYSYVKERFFEGETVEVAGHAGVRWGHVMAARVEPHFTAWITYPSHWPGTRLAWAWTGWSWYGMVAFQLLCP